MMWPFSAVAMPADSWPRCWSAYSAKYASRATSDSGANTPKTPHSSRGPSRSSSATRVMRSEAGADSRPAARLPLRAQGTNGSGERRWDGALVHRAQLADGHGQGSLDLEVAAP